MKNNLKIEQELKKINEATAIVNATLEEEDLDGRLPCYIIAVEGVVAVNCKTGEPIKKQ